MGLIKEPKGIDFTVGEIRITKADTNAFSDFFQQLKKKSSSNKLPKKIN